MTPIEIYVKQEVGRAMLSSSSIPDYASGLTFGLEMGMWFAEWAGVNGWKYRNSMQKWFCSYRDSTTYTTAELMAEFIKPENQKV